MNNATLASLNLLFDTSAQGLVWLDHQGQVLRSNAEAVCQSGLRTGDRAQGMRLQQAIDQAIAHRVPRRAWLGLRGPAHRAELACDVLPGPRGHDVWLLLHGPAKPAAEDLALLMALLGEGVRPPLRRAQQALLLARQEPDETTTALLFDELDNLLRQLDQAAELCSAWQPRPPSQAERLEPMMLLREAWAQAADEDPCPAVSVAFTGPADDDDLAPIYGHPDGLRRVMRECLLTAMRRAQPGAALQVALRQQGRHMALRIGVTAMYPALDDGSDAPDTESGVADTTHAEQLSLQLCRRLLASHGARLYATQGTEGREVVIELPTGAPAHDDHAALDLEQAQRYARDLAALMARVRGGTESRTDGR